MRICDSCGKEMIQGYYVLDNYFCSNKCLTKEYTLEEYNDLYKDDLAYWTKWEG